MIAVLYMSIDYMLLSMFYDYIHYPHGFVSPLSTSIYHKLLIHSVYVSPFILLLFFFVCDTIKMNTVLCVINLCLRLLFQLLSFERTLYIIWLLVLADRRATKTRLNMHSYYMYIMILFMGYVYAI